MSTNLDVQRFLNKLDKCFNRNDMRGARDCISFWENEARQTGDERALLTILNEAVGVYRRTQKKGKALNAMQEAIDLVEKLGLSDTLSGSTVYINAATTLSFLGEEEKSLALYDKAARCYISNEKTQTYEYATLLNNKAGALNSLKRYDEAEACWKEAVEILKAEGKHDGEIAISLIMLAHLTYDRDDTAIDATEALIDEAWDFLNSERLIKDGNYAYVLRKCAPSFDYFQRPIEAQALRDVAKEIYESNRQ
ncbi:MAG: tetratricopeptide repeat protein [Eubacterium sp.]|nr:tetratricopeptide repeat protein [Eubacterium sp.]MBR1531165.1 tetratricopeptide repeat protein [Eubacterium sp.]MBR1762253.1 tetratricopeptide repeat protein [Eubacterium sp.]